MSSEVAETPNAATEPSDEEIMGFSVAALKRYITSKVPSHRFGTGIEKKQLRFDAVFANSKWNAPRLKSFPSSLRRKLIDKIKEMSDSESQLDDSKGAMYVANKEEDSQQIDEIIGELLLILNKNDNASDLPAVEMQSELNEDVSNRDRNKVVDKPKGKGDDENDDLSSVSTHSSMVCLCVLSPFHFDPFSTVPFHFDPFSTVPFHCHCHLHCVLQPSLLTDNESEDMTDDFGDSTDSEGEEEFKNVDEIKDNDPPKSSQSTKSETKGKAKKKSNNDDDGGFLKVSDCVLTLSMS